MKFKADMYVPTKEEGGSPTPFVGGYRQFSFPEVHVPGTATLPEGVEMVMPGDVAREVTVELVEPVAVERGLRFAVVEGGRLVVACVATEVME